MKATKLKASDLQLGTYVYDHKHKDYGIVEERSDGRKDGSPLVVRWITGTWRQIQSPVPSIVDHVPLYRASKEEVALAILAE